MRSMRCEGGVTEILMLTQKGRHNKKSAQDKDSVQNRMSDIGLTSRREVVKMYTVT